MNKPISVAIIGGGIGGLTVAHELAERGGFEITIYEKNSTLGGKASSMMSPDGYPGERGIRGIPYFYSHFRNTMQRIPVSPTTSVLDNVTSMLSRSRRRLLFTDYDPVTAPSYFPFNKKGLKEHAAYRRSMMNIIPKSEVKDFQWRLFKVACMCDERRLKNYNHVTWPDFLDAKNKSSGTRKYLVRLPEFAVAARDISNAYSLAALGARVEFFALIYPFASQKHFLDVFNAPSTDALIDPWERYLKKLGVHFKMNTTITQIHCEDKKISSVTAVTQNQEMKINADIFVCALPVEIMQLLVTDPLKKIAPSLSHLNKLLTMPSSGIQFYFKNEKANVPKEWVVFMDSPWAIVCMYQSTTLWPHTTLKPPVKGILSVVFSNFDAPGTFNKKPAKACTAKEMKEEVMAQMRAHKGTEWIDSLDIESWHLDPGIQFSKETGIFEKHTTQLFVQPPGSWEYQPEAYTEIPNLYLAADYVRTTGNITSMEAANEAGRRAVNAILKQFKPSAKPCFIESTPKLGMGWIRWLDKHVFFKLQQLFKKT